MAIQSAKTAAILKNLPTMTDLALMAHLRETGTAMAGAEDLQNRMNALQAEMTKRIAAGGTKLQEELNTDNGAAAK